MQNNIGEQSTQYVRVKALLFVASFASIIANFLGYAYGWGMNSVCSQYFGCVNGFFGYDAFEHLLSGAAIVWLIIWLCLKFPKYSILQEKRWKTVLVLFACAALVAVMWELAECFHDLFRLDVLREPLLNIRLNINLLDQPTNLDTMGDFAFGLLGSAFACLWPRLDTK